MEEKRNQSVKRKKSGKVCILDIWKHMCTLKHAKVCMTKVFFFCLADHTMPD